MTQSPRIHGVLVLEKLEECWDQNQESSDRNAHNQRACRRTNASAVCSRR